MHALAEFDHIGCQNFARLGRAVYDYTVCGPWMVAVLADGREVHYCDAEAMYIHADTMLLAIKVGSTVEGTEACTEVITVTDPAGLSDAIDRVNDQACELWDELHEDEMEEG